MGAGVGLCSRGVLALCSWCEALARRWGATEHSCRVGAPGGVGCVLPAENGRAGGWGFGFGCEPIPAQPYSGAAGDSSPASVPRPSLLGLKAIPAINISASPPPAGLNGGMNVNGFSTVSHTTTSGTFTSSTHSSGPPHLHPYDCLWDYTQFQPPGGLKDGGLAQFPLNGVSGGSRPSSPGHSANLRGAGTELWGNGTPGPMGLNFDSQELYDSFPEQSFELMPNGPTTFYAAPQPSPMLGSGEPPFPLPEEELGGDADDAEASKELPPPIAENGAGLVGSMELEDTQPGRARRGVVAAGCVGPCWASCGHVPVRPQHSGPHLHGAVTSGWELGGSRPWGRWAAHSHGGGVGWGWGGVVPTGPPAPLPGSLLQLSAPCRSEALRLRRRSARRGAAGPGQPGPDLRHRQPGARIAHGRAAGGRAAAERRPPGALRGPGRR
uniref:Uncharacterized protein n=1 Tax=Phasianus colchicus TaxID=9054 RepID=A0A669Q7J1_PHACC